MLRRICSGLIAADEIVSGPYPWSANSQRELTLFMLRPFSVIALKWRGLHARVDDWVGLPCRFESNGRSKLLSNVRWQGCWPKETVLRFVRLDLETQFDFVQVYAVVEQGCEEQARTHAHTHAQCTCTHAYKLARTHMHARSHALTHGCTDA